MIRTLSVILIFLGLCYQSQGRSLESRVGLGVSLQEFNNLASLSVRYHFSSHVSSTFLVGFDTADLTGATILGMKVYRHAHLQENLNFFVGTAGFLLADKAGSTTTSSGIELDGLIGAEFFLSGLYSLAFYFETGVALRTIRNVTFTTIGGVGVHYYF